MYLILLSIQNTYEDNYLLELSDGYKSVYSIIDNFNPIKKLIINRNIYPGLILNIGLSLIDNITEDFKVYIKIFYNSLKLIYDNNVELGPLINEEFMFKNISELLTNGGEVSKISILVIKKYDYYINNFSKKQRISRSKQDEIEQDLQDNYDREYDSETKMKNNNFDNYKEPDNCIICFRIICVDSLVYKWMKDKNPNYNYEYVNQLSKIKCVLDFSVRSLEVFENFEEGKIYDICLLNMIKKGKNFTPTSTEKNYVKLFVNDMSIFKEEIMDKKYKNEDIYKDIMSQVISNFNLNKNNFDVCDYLNQIKFENGIININDEFIFHGLYSIYLDKLVKRETKSKDKIEEFNIRYLFFVGKNSYNILLQIHDINFFNFKVNVKGKKIYLWKNILFKSLLYYDNNLNEIVSFNNQRLKEGNEEYLSNAIIHLETFNYSTVKALNKGSEYENLKKQDIKQDFFKKIFKSIN